MKQPSSTASVIPAGLTTVPGGRVALGGGRRGRAGFTLVEMMVVLALIGVITAMVLPEMRGTYADAVLRAGGREWIAVCSLASSRAVGFNRVHRVRLDPSTREFRVERRSGRGPAGDVFEPVREVSGCQGTFDSRLTARLRPAESGSGSGSGSEPGAGLPPDAVEAGAAEGSAAMGVVSFYPDGTADGVELHLRDTEGFRLVLRVNPVTSRVKVVDVREGAR